MEWNNFAPVDPIRSLNPGVDSLYQCIAPIANDTYCSRWQLDSQAPSESIVEFKNKCQTGIGGQVRECCPENLKNSFNQKSVWVKSNPDGFYSSCLHDLNQGSQNQVKTLMKDPRYNYKDLTVNYAERVQRYRALLEKLRLVWVNSELAQLCQSGESVVDCLARVCPQQGYRLAENDYEICLASGDLLTPRNRSFCQSICSDTASSTPSVSNTSALNTGVSNTELGVDVQHLEQRVNYLLAKDQSLQEQNALERPEMLSNFMGIGNSGNSNYYDSLNIPLNPPGRGDYGGFSVVGYLQLVNYPDRRLPLYGRRVSPQTYQYYTVNHIDPQLRIPVGSNNVLNTNQTVVVPGYARPFRVILYGPDYQSYRPY